MDNKSIQSGKLLLYDSGKSKEFAGVVFHHENFWLTQSGMAQLFDRTPENVRQYLKNIYAEGGWSKGQLLRNF